MTNRTQCPTVRSMVNSFRDVIGLWPSLSAAAQETGASYEQVKKWRERDSIPGQWWLSVVQAAARRQIRLSVEDLALIAADGGDRADPEKVAS